MEAHIEALDEGILLVTSDPRYTQVGFNLVSVQVCGRSGLNSISQIDWIIYHRGDARGRRFEAGDPREDVDVRPVAVEADGPHPPP